MTLIDRYIRREKPKQKIRIDNRIHDFLLDLIEYRFLDTGMIQALRPELGKLRNLQRILDYLFNEGYIDRPPQQLAMRIEQGILQSEGKKVREYRDTVYALGDKGADLIYQNYPGKRKKIRWAEKNRKPQSPFIWHALKRNRFRIALVVGCRDREETNLLAWQQGRAIYDEIKIKGKPRPIEFDGFFKLEDKGDILNFLYEADRSTHSPEDFVRDKIEPVREWWRQGRHKEKFKANRIRVITTTLTEERAKNLRSLTREAYGADKVGDMFLFASEHRYNFQIPQSVFGPIWQSPKNDELHHILE